MVERKWVTLTNTSIGVFMGLLDSSIVLIALPTIGRELPDTSALVLLWVVLAYTLVTTTLLLTLGRLADMYGRVRMYTLGFAIFTVGSLFASLAQSGPELLAARVFQGVGGGFLAANSVAILTDAFPANERGRALGINQVVAILGSILGLVLGGILTTTLGWRSIFWVNVPIGIFGTLWAYWQLEERHPPERNARVDWLGNVTFGVGLTSVLIAVTFGAISGWSDLWIPATVVGGLALLVVFVWVERRVTRPMLKLSLFRIRTLTAGNLAQCFAGLARGAFTFIMVFYFQGVLFLSPERAGILLIPISAAFAVTGPIAGTVSDRTGARWLGTTGLLVSATGFVILIGFPANGPYNVLAAAMVLLGVGQAMFAAPNRAEVMSSVAAADRGIAGGMGSLFLNSGNLGSLALGFTILAGSVPRSTLDAIFSGAPSFGGLDVGAFMGALHVLFSIGLGLTLTAAVTNALRGRPPESRTVHRERPPHPPVRAPVRGGGASSPTVTPAGPEP